MFSRCTEWEGLRNPGGYGLRFTGKTAQNRSGNELAHRVAYREAFGEFDKKLCVLHKCDNPPCINPEHLFLGTRKDNNLDAFKKGRRYSKLKEEQVLEIRKRLTDKERPVDLAREYGVKPCQIGAIKFKRQWRHI